MSVCQVAGRPAALARRANKEVSDIDSSIKPTEGHAGSRYGCVTERLIDLLQQDYFAGRTLGASIPFDPDEAAIIVAESLEADRMIDTLPERLLSEGKMQPPAKGLSDWTMATLSELFREVAELSHSQGKRKQAQEMQAVAWALLDEVAQSPTASPMLWYEDIYYDVAQEMWHRGEREAIDYVQRALAHNLHYSDGSNAESLLRDLAEAHLWLGDLDAGLSILAAVLRYDPGDIWTLNVIALTFGRFGLADSGAEGARRGLELLEATADPHGLHDQIHDALERLQLQEERGREADVTPAVLAGFRAALAADFDARQDRPILELCRELIPDLDEVPVKRPPDKPDLAPPQEGAQRRDPATARAKLGRNAPCWCGSGKKYKHCHWRADRSRS